MEILKNDQSVVVDWEGIIEDGSTFLEVKDPWYATILR